MRKILAGFLATSMIVAVASSVTFAASSASATMTVDQTGLGGEHYDNVRMTIDPDGAGSLPAIVVSAPINFTGSTAQALAESLNGVRFNNIEIGKKLFDAKLVVASGSTTVQVQFTPDAALPGFVAASATLNLEIQQDKVVSLGSDNSWMGIRSGGDVGFTSVGTGTETADIEKEGTALNVEDVIVCDGEGNPIPLTEDPRGVDNDLNTDDGVQSGKTVYFMIKDGQYKFNDDAYWKLKVSKGDNGKYVKAVSDVTKNFSSNLYNAVNGSVVNNTGGARHRYIKVELAEIFTDDEYKIKLDMRLTAKSPAARVYSINEDTEFKVSDFAFYMKNLVKPADNDWKVGIGGLMLNPLENDWNEVTYFDEDGDLAFMKFFADSDVGKFYAKLSTKWEHADYASYFNDQDAYIFDFVGSPKISATSRCDLQIYNPFVNEDGDETIDPASATIYQVIDGDLFDVTDSFKYEEGNNGDMAFTTRTRFLGTYIICEKPVEEAVDDSTDVPADLVPEDTTPVEVTPGNDNGGKAPANTGKYL